MIFGRFFKNIFSGQRVTFSLSPYNLKYGALFNYLNFILFKFSGEAKRIFDRNYVVFGNFERNLKHTLDVVFIQIFCAVIEDF